MGCGSGTCGIEIVPSDAGDEDGDSAVTLVNELAVQGAQALSDGDACCAFCAGIRLEPIAPPEHAGKMLKRGYASPLSILAYKAAYAARQGKEVALEPNGPMPTMTIDGKQVDPMRQYHVGECVKGAC